MVVMEAELAKVMSTGVVLDRTSPHVSADAFRRLSKFGKAMMLERMRTLSAADRKYRDDEREKERGRMRVMAPGAASAISALRGVEAETRARNKERRLRAVDAADREIERMMRAASEEREAAGVARSRSGSPVRAVRRLGKGKYIIGISSGPTTSPFASAFRYDTGAGNLSAAKDVLVRTMKQIAPTVNSGLNALDLPFMGERGYQQIMDALIGKGLGLRKGQKAVAHMEIKDLHRDGDARLVEFGVERDGRWMSGYTDVHKEFIAALKDEMA